MPNLIETENSRAAVQPALILIPDISGFTDYMSNSDMLHCGYIIAELLEVILNSNMLDLSVSELEGDAVLFYKFGKPPSFENIIDHCSFIYNSFHRYLRQFNNDRLCNCKCCNNAVNLAIKFVVHYGKVSPVVIKSHEKLFGSDVILSHRLLKSNVTIPEYILFSNTYLLTQNRSELTKIIAWDKINKGKVDFEHLGSIDYYFIDLSMMKDKIFIEKRSIPNQNNNESIKYKIYIDTPPEFVRAIITNFKFKPNWITVLQDISFEERTIPRIGARHKCLMSDIFFKTILIDYFSVYINEERTKYVEKLSSRYINLQIFLTYNLKSKGLGTMLYLELNFPNRGLRSFLIKSFFNRKVSKKKIRTSLSKLKFLCEEIYNKYYEQNSPDFKLGFNRGKYKNTVK